MTACPPHCISPIFSNSLCSYAILFFPLDVFYNVDSAESIVKTRQPTTGVLTDLHHPRVVKLQYIQPAFDHIICSPTNNLSKSPAVDLSCHMGIDTALYNYSMYPQRYLHPRTQPRVPQHPPYPEVHRLCYRWDTTSTTA